MVRSLLENLVQDLKILEVESLKAQPTNQEKGGWALRECVGGQDLPNASLPS
jgi:hypothetical protein